MKKILIIYIPVIHQGYLRFINENKDCPIYLVNEEIIKEIGKEIPYFLRGIQAFDGLSIKTMLKALLPNREINLLDLEIIKKIKPPDDLEIIMPKEDISLEIIDRYFPSSKTKLISVFLRWDRLISLTENEVSPDRIISTDNFDRDVMKFLIETAQKSSDWWRQVGAFVLKDKIIIFEGYNQHLPHSNNPNILGDPRSNFNAGERIDLCTAIHAEAQVIAKAAKKGKPLDGCDLYVSTFPCPTCARLIGTAGIKRLFYFKGYSLLDAEDILKAFGVEIILVLG